MIELRSNDFYKLGKFHQNFVLGLLKSVYVSKEAFMQILHELKLMIENWDSECDYCAKALVARTQDTPSRGFHTVYN